LASALQFSGGKVPAEAQTLLDITARFASELQAFKRVKVSLAQAALRNFAAQGI